MDDYTGESIPSKGGSWIKYILGFGITAVCVGVLYLLVMFFVAHPVAFIWFILVIMVSVVTYIVANTVFGD